MGRRRGGVRVKVGSGELHYKETTVSGVLYDSFVQHEHEDAVQRQGSTGRGDPGSAQHC